jgi:hypothetical protein
MSSVLGLVISRTHRFIATHWSPRMRNNQLWNRRLPSPWVIRAALVNMDWNSSWEIPSSFNTSRTSALALIMPASDPFDFNASRSLKGQPREAGSELPIIVSTTRHKNSRKNFRSLAIGDQVVFASHSNLDVRRAYDRHHFQDFGANSDFASICDAKTEGHLFHSIESYELF